MMADKSIPVHHFSPLLPPFVIILNLSFFFFIRNCNSFYMIKSWNLPFWSSSSVPRNVGANICFAFLQYHGVGFEFIPQVFYYLAYK